MGKAYNSQINSSYSEEFLNWQDAFYSSKKWIKLRDKVKNKYFGICQICGTHKGTMIIHHIEEITPANCNNPLITLNEDNLTCICTECHSRLHNKSMQIRKQIFDEEGNLIYAD